MYPSRTNSNGRVNGGSRGSNGSTVAKKSGLTFGSPGDGESNMVVSFMVKTSWFDLKFEGCGLVAGCW